MPKRRRATAEEREKVIENMGLVAHENHGPIHWCDLVRRTTQRSAGLGLDKCTIHNICLGPCSSRGQSRGDGPVRRIARGVYVPRQRRRK
jgi:hypothetical protein